MTANPPRVGFDTLKSADLIIDAIYEGRGSGSVSDDPIAQVLPVGNLGGFRCSGSVTRGGVKMAVLYTTGDEPDWPDSLDLDTGTFVYYGDNRRPGRQLHETKKGGNHLLRSVFEATHATPEQRGKVPPFLLFEKVPRSGRDVRFRGLLAPGSPVVRVGEDLVALWRTSRGSRFQNYRAIFTVLDVHTISRSWILELLEGRTLGLHCPLPWRKWVDAHRYEPLIAPRTTVTRSRAEQLPDDKDLDILVAIREHFRGREYLFESAAVEIWRLIAPSTGKCDVTRPTRDGGMDAVGEYHIGPPADRVAVEFALEAKCYDSNSSVGVRDVSRLIARLRYRQFGVFVTTSFFNQQVYEEIRGDGHPLVLVCGRDIVEALQRAGLSDRQSITRWLETFI